MIKASLSTPAEDILEIACAAGAALGIKMSVSWRSAQGSRRIKRLLGARRSGGSSPPKEVRDEPSASVKSAARSRGGRAHHSLNGRGGGDER